MNSTMPMTSFHPGPGQGNGPSAVRDRHQQQLVPKANLAAIHDQTDFPMSQPLDDCLGDRLIPFSYSDGTVVQLSSHAPGQTRRAGCSRDLLSYLAQVNRTAFVQSDHQPIEVSDPGDPFLRAKFF